MWKKMRALMLLVLCLCFSLAAGGECSSRVSGNGYYNGIKLCGKVKVVNHFADIKVQVVDSFPDLKVQVVEHFPDQIGKWQFVDSFPDFTVQFVTSFPDIKIKYVNSFPGVN